MRLRVLLATMVTVVLTVLMLGIPLAASWLMIVKVQLKSDLTTYAGSIAQGVDAQLYKDKPITPEFLGTYLEQKPEYNAYIKVVLNDGSTVEAGNNTGPDDDLEVSTLSGVAHRNVLVSVPASVPNGEIASAWVLIVIAAFAAMTVALAVGLWQAQRIAAPLMALADRAEEIGEGRTRARWQRSRIPEIDRVAKQLEKSADALSERLAAERVLASDASHQLRTPLTALSMRLDEILMTTEQDDVREEARISLQQVDRLTDVVHDLINAPRSSQRRTPGVAELSQILRQQAEEWRPAFDAKSRSLVVTIPSATAVWGSRGPLTQVVATLIENSLAHGGGRTTATVRHSGNSVVVEVEDEGPGVSSDIGHRIFERSFSGPESTGTGVGLALARDLVEDDGGRLELVRESPPLFAVFLTAAPSGDEDDRDGEKLSAGAEDSAAQTTRRPRRHRD